MSNSKELKRAGGAVVPEDAVTLHEEEIPSPWIGTDGTVAHPDSPVGAGGPGHFRKPGPIDGKGKQSFTIPHPSTLNGRNHVLSSDEETALEKSKKPKVKTQPPPTTKTESFQRKIAKNKQNVKVDFTIKILADLTDQGAVDEGTADTGPVQDTFSLGIEWAKTITDEAKTEVTKVDGVNILSGVVELQVRYGPKTKANQKVAYGRGTTEQDIADGNITIGFHEHCHLQDWWNYLKTAVLPLNFEGKVGMSPTAYAKKQSELETKFENFIAAGDTLTYNQTDEVGDPKESEYKSG